MMTGFVCSECDSTGWCDDNGATRNSWMKKLPAAVNMVPGIVSSTVLLTIVKGCTAMFDPLTTATIEPIYAGTTVNKTMTNTV